MTERKPVIQASDIKIRYKLGDFKDIGLKEWLMRHITGNYYVQDFMAVDGVSFELFQGDMLGIIGSNGAGKSTLLKVISGIMEPSGGSVRVDGNVAALLELGSGFDGNLSVVENAYLRGAMLGYTKAYMDETIEAVIDFAGLQDFRDRPFKQLSSGMQSRLAFSIASMVNPDILILDEVLSVGDGAFQEKSARKMREILESGATTILVSHSLAQIRNICKKVLWIEHGKQIAFSDDVQSICDQYQDYLDGRTALDGIKAPGLLNAEEQKEEKLPHPNPVELLHEKVDQLSDLLDELRGGVDQRLVLLTERSEQIVEACERLEGTMMDPELRERLIHIEDKSNDTLEHLTQIEDKESETLKQVSRLKSQNDAAREGIFRLDRDLASAEGMELVGAVSRCKDDSDYDETVFPLNRRLLEYGVAAASLLRSVEKKPDPIALETSDLIRTSALSLIADEIHSRSISGEVAEFGVARGDFARVINALFPERKLYLFDTFDSFNERDMQYEEKHSYALELRPASLRYKNIDVREVLSRMRYPENCIVRQGYFPSTAEGLEELFCFVSIDCDLYQPIYAGLQYFYPRLTEGGCIFVHDYLSKYYRGVRPALRKYADEHGIRYAVLPDNAGTAVILK